MTTPESRAVLRPAPASADGSSDGYTGGPVWMWVLPPAVMLAMGLWRITGPSYWRDEGATLTAVHRSFPQLLRMLRNVDAVHGAYYVIMWPLVHAFGTGPVVTRLPSVVAMAVAAAAVAAIGRRLVSPGAGLAAGLTFAILPQVSRYAQDARSYAMVAAFGTTASYLLIRAMGTAGRRRGWLAGYTVCMGAMGLLNIFGVLLIAAHAVTVGLACLRKDDRWRALAAQRGGRAAAARSLALGWLAAAVVAVIVAGPALAGGVSQRGTAVWIKPPGRATLANLSMLVGPGQMIVACALVIAAGVAVSAWSGRARLRAAWPPQLTALTVPWIVLPPALLLGLSFVQPLFVTRYVLYCLPAVALLVGAGLAVVGRIAGPAALVVIALLGLSIQLHVRAPNGHGDNIRGADRIIVRYRHPGDAVIYGGQDANYFTAAYPYGLAQLDNIAQDKTAAENARLVGTTLPVDVVQRRLAGVSRVWAVDASGYPKSEFLEGMHIHRLGAWKFGQIWLVLYRLTRT
jgi:mannosyltransferase